LVDDGSDDDCCVLIRIFAFASVPGYAKKFNRRRNCPKHRHRKPKPDRPNFHGIGQDDVNYPNVATARRPHRSSHLDQWNMRKKIWNGVVQYQPAKRPSFERRARSNLPVVVIVDACVVWVLVDSPRSQRSIGPVAFRDST